MYEWDNTTINIYNKLEEYNLIDYYKSIIKKTNESQGHGKAMELSIQKNIFNMKDEDIKTYKPTELHDIRKEHNKLDTELFKKKNISIKTTTRNEIDCADILRFLKSTDTNLICIKMKQQNDLIKEATKTICFSIDEFLKNKKLL